MSIVNQPWTQLVSENDLKEIVKSIGSDLRTIYPLECPKRPEETFFRFSSSLHFAFFEFRSSGMNSVTMTEIMVAMIRRSVSLPGFDASSKQIFDAELGKIEFLPTATIDLDEIAKLLEGSRDRKGKGLLVLRVFAQELVTSTCSTAREHTLWLAIFAKVFATQYYQECVTISRRIVENLENLDHLWKMMETLDQNQIPSGKGQRFPKYLKTAMDQLFADTHGYPSKMERDGLVVRLEGKVTETQILNYCNNKRDRESQNGTFQKKSKRVRRAKCPPKAGSPKNRSESESSE